MFEIIIVCSPCEVTRLPSTANPIYIGVEKGCLSIMQAHKPLHYAVGDFDSVTDAERQLIHDYADSFEQYPQAKDLVDGEIAVQKAITLNKNKILFYAHGTNLEYDLASLFLVKKYNVTFMNNNSYVFLAKKGEHIIKPKAGYKYINFITDEYAVISLKNFLYKASNLELKALSPRALHNEFIKQISGYLEIHEGCVYIMYSEHKEWKILNEKFLQKWNLLVEKSKNTINECSSIALQKVIVTLQNKLKKIIDDHIEKDDCRCLSDKDWLNKGSTYQNLAIKQGHQSKIIPNLELQYIIKHKFDYRYIESVLDCLFKKILGRDDLFELLYKSKYFSPFRSDYLFSFIISSLLFNLQQFLINFCFFIYGIKHFTVSEIINNEFFLHFPKYVNNRNKLSIYKMLSNEYDKQEEEGQECKWKWLKERNDNFNESTIKNLRDFFTHRDNYWGPSINVKAKTGIKFSYKKDNPWIFYLPFTKLASNYNYKGEQLHINSCVKDDDPIDLFEISKNVFKECNEILDYLLNFIKGLN